MNGRRPSIGRSGKVRSARLTDLAALGDLSRLSQGEGTDDGSVQSLGLPLWVKPARLENDIGDIGKRRADRNGVARPQALPAGVGARLGRPVGVDDLTSGARPRLHERAGERFAGGHDIPADRVGEIDLGRCRQRGEQDRRTE